MSARVKLPEPLDRLLRSQLETAIQEAALHRDDDISYIMDEVKRSASRIAQKEGVGN